MGDETRILVTGSRDWRDVATIMRALRQAVTDFPAGTITVVHGAARGADLLAAGLAEELDWRTESHPVTADDWTNHGDAAGPIRNQDMVDLGADVCLAFFMPCRKPACHKPKPHDSHGADDCARRALLAGIPVRPHRSTDG